MVESRFDAFCRQAFQFLDECQVRHLVIGGLAVAAVGEPRTTGDADVIAFISQEEAERLIEKGAGAGFELKPLVEKERLQTTGTLRFRKGRFQLDMILASLPFEEAAFRRSSRRKLFGRQLNFPTPEDLILFKVLSGRDKDLVDAAGVARRHGKKLDRKYIEESLRPICDLAEDLTPLKRLREVLEKGAGGSG